MALQQKDWSAARRYFAAALPLIAQLETAPQAREALASIAYLQWQTGQVEEAMALIGLAQHHPSSYQESKDRVAALEMALRAVLSPEQVQVALARGQGSALWSAPHSKIDNFLSMFAPLAPTLRHLKISARIDKALSIRALAGCRREARKVFLDADLRGITRIFTLSFTDIRVIQRLSAS